MIEKKNQPIKKLSPTVRRSNSYRIALRKSGVPKELFDGNSESKLFSDLARTEPINKEDRPTNMTYGKFLEAKHRPDIRRANLNLDPNIVSFALHTQHPSSSSLVKDKEENLDSNRHNVVDEDYNRKLLNSSLENDIPQSDCQHQKDRKNFNINSTKTKNKEKRKRKTTTATKTQQLFCFDCRKKQTNNDQNDGDHNCYVIDEDYNCLALIKHLLCLYCCVNYCCGNCRRRSYAISSD